MPLDPGARKGQGARAERAVAEHLRAEGFDVVGMNVRFGALEIDIIARRDGLLVFVEVRARGPGAFQRPLASIGPKKRATMVRAAERAWRERFAADGSLERLRLDVAGVTFEGDEPRIEYVPGAVTA